MEHDADYYNKYKTQEAKFQSYIKQKNAFGKQAKVVGSVYILPVVVHIVHNNGPENISDAQVINAIDYLNEAYSHVSPYDGPNGVNTEIQFCLAKQDPLGNFTTGINRVVSATYTDIPYFDSAKDLALKNLSRWDPSLYINIWVIKNIQGSTAGYAFLPPGGIASLYDGIVLEYGYMGSSKDANNVLTHEMGHYLGLQHTFEGGCPNNNCLTDGDGICDTPPDATKFTCSDNSCVTDPDDPSASNPFRSAGLGGLGDQPDMTNNYMDYSSFSCQNAFTQGQKDRMRFFTDPALGGRKTLHISNGCEPPCSSPITGDYTYSAPVNSGVATLFTNTTSSSATNYEWYINGTLVNTTKDLLYTFSNGGIYTVELIAMNAEISCAQHIKKTINVICPSLGASFSASGTSVNVGNALSFTNVTSTVLDTSGKNNWYVDNVLISNTKDFSYVFPVKGTVYVKLVVGANSTLCTSEYIIPVNVNCPAHADFTMTANDVPINTVVGFTNTGLNCTSATWLINTISNGSASTMTNNFSTTGEYLVSLVCDNGTCKDTANKIVNVYDPFSCGSNKQANYWYFGAKAGLKFDSSPPTALFDGAMTTQEGVSSISNKSGNLLFYTNGVKIWDRTHAVMLNGSGLTGATTSTQSALIVPQPGNDSLYYVFTTDSLGENGLRGLRYSRVNMNLNSGLGGVMAADKNTLLESSSNEQVTSIQHGNTCDLWIVAHRNGTNEYLAYLLSSSGISTTPVVSATGVTNVKIALFGYLKGSPDGGKLASAMGPAGVELSDFDNFSGTVSNSGTLTLSGQTTYGAEFSPNSKLLYISSAAEGSTISGASRKVNQFNVAAGSFAAINASLFVVANELITGQQGPSCGALQMGADAKIYVAIPNASYVSCIGSPDIPNAGCNYTSASVSLAGPGRTTLSYKGLPAIYSSAIQTAYINFSCVGGASVSFNYEGNVTNPDTYFWDFGDPLSGTSNYSNDANPTHIFTSNTSFTVKLIVKKMCYCAVVTKQINLPLPCALSSNLLAFKGLRNGTDATLKWEKLNEKDLRQYELERRFESVSEFESVILEGIKSDCGYSCLHTVHDKIPAHLVLENVYYRLKITSLNGMVEYSNIIRLGPYDNGNASIRLYPNPLGPEQSLTIESDQNIEAIEINDIAGRIIFQEEGLNTTVFKTELNIISGMYIVRILNETGVSYLRLLVNK